MCLTASGDVSQLVRLMCLTFPMREKSVTEQRYDAVLGVISEDPLQNETHNRIGRATNQPELLRGLLSCLKTSRTPVARHYGRASVR